MPKNARGRGAAETPPERGGGRPRGARTLADATSTRGTTPANACDIPCLCPRGRGAALRVKMCGRGILVSARSWSVCRKH